MRRNPCRAFIAARAQAGGPIATLACRASLSWSILLEATKLGNMNRNRRKICDFNWKKYGRTAFAVVQMTADALILAGLSAAAIAYELVFRLSYAKPNDLRLYVLATTAAIIAAIGNFARSGLYDALRAAAPAELLSTTARRLVEVFFGLTGCLFILKISDSFSRFWLVVWAGSSVIALGGLRLIALNAARRLIRSGKMTRNLAVVGANETGRQFAAGLAQDGPDTRLVGVFDRNPSRGLETLPVRDMAALDLLLAKGEIDEIVIATPVSADERIADLTRRFHPFPVSLRIIAPQGFENIRVLESRRYGQISTFLVIKKPLDEVESITKWLEDKVIAAVCLFATLPLLLFIALAIKLDSHGPVLFRQKRLGANDRPFDLLKFRSMHVDQSDLLGRQLTRAGDPRVTRVGRFLRRTSLDELPQLINVLRGEMSLVGPRPHPLAAQAGGVPYVEAVDDYPLRHRVKPGMTGWAQVNGWRGETTKIEQLMRRVECDLYYVENWSLTFDLLILWRTLFTVLSGQNAV
jgi:Undecaprenyl-phosphate glucose phosphotransferase